MRYLTTNEYLETPRPKLNWIVHQKIPNPGMTLISGPPKSGKSFLALDLALAVAQGRPFLNWSVTQSKVLYLQFDVSELIWRQRLENMRELGVSLDGQIYTVHPEDMRLPINILNPHDQAWLTLAVKECDPQLVILDVLREIHNADENDSSQMKYVGDVLVKIFKDRSVVLVHHSKKLNDEIIDPSPAEVARGSSYLTGKMDALWLLWNNRLYIQDRISEAQTVKLRQTPSGIWTRV